LPLETLMLFCFTGNFVVSTHFFGPRRHNHALFNESFVERHVEVFVDLLVVDEAQVCVVPLELARHAVDRVDGTPLKLVDVASDYLGALPDIRDQQRNLVLI